MKISTLSIKNFRSISELDIDLPNVCAFVGPNNAGKTNILEAIRRVLMPEYGPRAADFAEDDVHLRDPEKNIEIALTFDAPIPYARLQRAQPVEIASLKFTYERYKRGENRGLRHLEQAALGTEGQPLMVQKTYGGSGKRPDFEPLTSIPREVRDQIPFIHIGINRSLAAQLPSARNSLLRRMFEDIDQDLRAPSQTIELQRRDGTTVTVSRLERFRTLIAAAMALLKTAEFDKLESAIKRHALDHLGLDAAVDDLDLYFTPLDTFDFYKSLDLMMREGDFTISATQMGGGMQNAIVLGILRAFEETRRQGAIILIEEPEMFLHPQMQRSLYATLRRLGDTNQIIYTTHSPHFVSIPEYRSVLLVRRTKTDGTMVTRSNLSDEPWRREKLRQALDAERSELYFARRILIVEGDTERLSLPEFAKKLGVDIDSAAATVVEVGGKRNLIDIATLAISFGIPTGIIYDKDSRDFKKRDEENEYNKRLDDLAKTDGSVRVWQLDPDYEACARQAAGDSAYQALMQRYPEDQFGKGKARRGRMIACDEDMPVPSQIGEAIRWLTDKDSPYDGAREAVSD
jgi:putative ATP-dependent endonuclease of OLD family